MGKARDKLRARMFEVYGDRCVCCGESNKKFLTLDHIQNDGWKEKQFGKHRKSNWYKLAIKHPDKNRFQILCWNCNMGKAKNGGVCPHKEQTSAIDAMTKPVEVPESPAVIVSSEKVGVVKNH